MADQEFFAGSVGPLLYDDTDTYPDGETLRAFRGSQIFIENAPTSDEEVVRQMDLVGSVEAVWPVGSVFISVVATNPATLLGFGTWTALGAGKVLIGLDAGDANFDVVEETGGSKTHKHVIDPPEAHTGPALG